MTEPLKIETVEVPADYDRLVVSMQQVIDALPPLDFDALRKELTQLAVSPPALPTFQSICEDLQMVSKYCDRATAISIDVMEHAHTLTQVTELLTDGWVKFSREKLAGNKAAEAKLKTCQYAMRTVQATNLFKAATAVAKTLENKYRSLVGQKDCLERISWLGENAGVTYRPANEVRAPRYGGPEMDHGFAQPAPSWDSDSKK